MKNMEKTTDTVSNFHIGCLAQKSKRAQSTDTNFQFYAFLMIFDVDDLSLINTVF